MNWYTDTAGACSFEAQYIHIRFGPPAPPAIPAPLLNACAVLGLTPPIESYDVVKQRYRKLARENHPDHGGDPERMKAINAAFDLLTEARPR